MNSYTAITESGHAIMSESLVLGASHADPYFWIEDEPESDWSSVVCSNEECDDVDTVFILPLGATRCPTCRQEGHEDERT